MKKRENGAKQTAVALRYPKGFPAPFIACKGSGRLAQLMTAAAEEYGIPVAFEPETAQILSLQEVGSYIPPETYEVLVGIFAFIKKAEDYANN